MVPLRVKQRESRTGLGLQIGHCIAHSQVNVEQQARLIRKI
jgi:hypothetical protein